MLTWPHGWQVNVLFALRWTHLLSGTLWLGLALFFDRVWRRFLKEADRDTASRARRLLEPRLLVRYEGGFSRGGDRFCRLHPRAFGRRAGVSGARVAGRLEPRRWGGQRFVWFSARSRALADGRLLGAALAVWLAAVAASGDWYMSRGGSHKTVALSLGGGLALVMLANVWLILAMGSASHLPFFRTLGALGRASHAPAR